VNYWGAPPPSCRGNGVGHTSRLLYAGGKISSCKFHSFLPERAVEPIELLPVLFGSGKRCSKQPQETSPLLANREYPVGKLYLMKTRPWHSTEQKERTDEVEVHHDNTSCKGGENIERNHHRYGTDNRPLCKQCSQLDATGR